MGYRRIAGAGVAIYLKSPERRRAVGKYVVPVIDAFGKELNSAALQEQHGLRRLREVMLPASARPSVKQQTAIILARQREPLLAREVQEHMLAHFASERVPTVAEVRSALKDSSEFAPARALPLAVRAGGGFLARLGPSAPELRISAAISKSVRGLDAYDFS